MKCWNCENDIPESSKFCEYCGRNTSKEIKSESDNKLEQHTNINLKSEEKLKLTKTYKNAADLSMGLSIFGFIVTLLGSFENNSVSQIILTAVIMLIMVLPFYYYGKKLKKKGTENIHYAYKISIGMLVYSIIFVAFNLSFGGIGFLWLILVYYWYRALIETKKIINLKK